MLQRKGLGMSAFGWRVDCRGRSEGKTIQWECFGISLDLCGCCGGRGGRTCPRCRGCTTPGAPDNSLLQNILGLPAAVKRQSVCKIQAVKPQPGLGISFRRKPTDDGELLWYERFAGNEGSVSRRWSIISRLAHNGAPVSPVI